MSDPGGCAVGRPPTAAEVVGRLKDDGDFDALRRAIIRKEVLRNNIISEVKQSVVLQEEGSERMKLKDLSDAIFQDIGSKIMGQISDEVWNVIQSNETDIQGTVKAVYNRILNPEKVPEPSSKKLKREGKDEQVLPTKTATAVAVEAEDDDPEKPPGFGFGSTQRNNIGATKLPMSLEIHNEVKPNGGEPAAISNTGDDEMTLKCPLDLVNAIHKLQWQCSNFFISNTQEGKCLVFC